MIKLTLPLSIVKHASISKRVEFINELVGMLRDKYPDESITVYFDNKNEGLIIDNPDILKWDIYRIANTTYDFMEWF